MSGSAQALITLVANGISAPLAVLGWQVETARGDLSAIECLYRQGDMGLAVVKWRGAVPQAQSRASLVARHRFSVILSARRPLGQDALGQLADNPADARLLEAVDAVRATVRCLSIPAPWKPSPQDERPVFVSDNPLALPDGYPTDAVEQTWEAVLRDTDFEIPTPPQEPEESVESVESGEEPHDETEGE